MKKRFLTLLLASVMLVACGKQETKKEEVKQTEQKQQPTQKVEEKKKEQKEETKQQNFKLEKINETEVNKKISLKNADITITLVSKNKFTFLDNSFLERVKRSSKNDREIQKATTNNPIGNLTIYLKAKNKSNKTIHIPLYSPVGAPTLQTNIPTTITNGQNLFNDNPTSLFNLAPNQEGTFILNYFVPIQEISNINKIELLFSYIFQVKPSVAELEKIGNQKFNID